MSTLTYVAVFGTLLAFAGMWLFSSLSTAGKCSPEKAAQLIKDQYKQYDENYQPVPDISEPVYAIARAMKERPGTFRIEWLNERHQTSCTIQEMMNFDKYRITDRKTGLVATIIDHHYGMRHSKIRLPFKLTDDEWRYLWKVGEDWIRERQARTVEYRSAKRRKEWARKYGVGV